MKVSPLLLTAAEVATLVGAFTNVIEIAVLDVTASAPSVVFSAHDDIVGDATLAVMRSLAKFQRKYLSAANVTAYVRKSARWTALNAVERIRMRTAVRATGTANYAVPPMADRDRDYTALARAFEVLDAPQRTMLLGVMAGEKSGDIAKRIKVSKGQASKIQAAATAKVAAILA